MKQVCAHELAAIPFLLIRVRLQQDCRLPRRQEQQQVSLWIAFVPHKHLQDAGACGRCNKDDIHHQESLKGETSMITG